MAFRRSKDEHVTLPGSSLFLGAVVAKPTADEEAPVAAEFSLLLARVSKLMDMYHSASITAHELAQQLSRERVIDTDGGEWTVGASTGVWYRRRPGANWAQVPPPGPTVKARELLAVSLEAEARAADDASNDSTVDTDDGFEAPHLSASGELLDDSGDEAHVAPPPVPTFTGTIDATPPAPSAPTPPKFFGSDLQEQLPEDFGREDVSPDAGWVADLPDLDGVSEVDARGVAMPTPPTPEIPEELDAVPDTYKVVGGSVARPADDDETADPGADEVVLDADDEELLRRWLNPDT